MEPEKVAALALGGNVGDVASAFVAALAALDAAPAIAVIARSSVWRTPPWGKTDQPDFLNMAALVRTSLAPHALLDLCLSLERAAGRVRDERWGPRTLDVDIIDFDGRRIADPRLTLPHPRAAERAFVLAPLAEIAPDLPLAGESVGALAARVGAAQAVPGVIDRAATDVVRRAAAGL